VIASALALTEEVSPINVVTDRGFLSRLA
jgi:hypothetical protein